MIKAEKQTMHHISPIEINFSLTLSPPFTLFKYLLVILFVLSFSSNLGELFVNRYAVNSINGVVGIPGVTIPINPSVREIIPNDMNINLSMLLKLFVVS